MNDQIVVTCPFMGTIYSDSTRNRSKANLKGKLKRSNATFLIKIRSFCIENEI